MAYPTSSMTPRVEGSGVAGLGDSDMEMVIEDQFGNKVSLPGEISGDDGISGGSWSMLGRPHRFYSGKNVTLPSLYSLIVGSPTSMAFLEDPYWSADPSWLQEAADKVCARSPDMEKCLKDPLLSLRGVWAGHLASAANSPDTSPMPSASPCPCCGYLDNAEYEADDLDWPDEEEEPVMGTMSTQEGYWSDGYCESEYSEGEMPDAGIEPGVDRRDSTAPQENCAAGRGAPLPFGSVDSMMQFVLDRNSLTVSAGLVVDSARRVQHDLRHAH